MKCNTYQHEKKHKITGRNHKTCFTSSASIYLVLLISYLDKIDLQSNMKTWFSSCTGMLKQMMRLNTQWDQSLFMQLYVAYYHYNQHQHYCYYCKLYCKWQHSIQLQCLFFFSKHLRTQTVSLYLHIGNFINYQGC